MTVAELPEKTRFRFQIALRASRSLSPSGFIEAKNNMFVIAKEIEKRFQGSMEVAAERISRHFSKVRTSISSFENESEANPTHVLALECLFIEADSDQADLVALCITTEYLTTNPQMLVDIYRGVIRPVTWKPK